MTNHLVIYRGRWEERPDVWICGWIFDYFIDGAWIIMHSQEDRPSEAELRDLAVEFECPVTIEDNPLGRPSGQQ